MEEKVRRILSKEYPGARIELELLPESGKVTGMIVWEGFEDQEAIDRQGGLYRLLRKELGADAQHVSLIFTYTPNEIRAMEAA